MQEMQESLVIFTSGLVILLKVPVVRLVCFQAKQPSGHLEASVFLLVLVRLHKVAASLLMQARV